MPKNKYNPYDAWKTVESTRRSIAWQIAQARATPLRHKRKEVTHQEDATQPIRITPKGTKK